MTESLFPDKMDLVNGFLELTQDLTSDTPFPEKMTSLCRAVVALIRCDRSSIFLVEGGWYRAKFNFGNPPDIAERFPRTRFPLDHPLFSRLAESRTYLLINEVAKSPLLTEDLVETVEASRIRSIVLAPLSESDGSPMGFLTGEYNENPGAFSTLEATLICGLAKLTEIVIRADRLESQYQRSVERMRESEERFATLFRSNPAAISLTHLDNNQLIDVNQAWQELTGYERSEALHRTAVELKLWVDIKQREKVIEDLQTQCVKQIEAQLRRKSGEILDILLSAEIVEMADERYLLTMAQDISELKKAEQRLEQTVDTLQKTMRAIIQVLSRTVELRDPYTSGHQRRTAALAQAIAEAMGLPERQREGLVMAGIIHDLGKISLPAEILIKPTTLTPLEYQLIRSHCEIGYAILKDLDFPWPIAEIVLQHHERLDGSGYPRGLKGDEIIFEARILMVADVVEAMASHRPYRPALGIDAALKEIERNQGVLYDPQVVETCRKLFREKGFEFED